ncbi:2120_t:CDS:2 [Paraglomus occultum]|uniref:2120_t:CDS:1 n=1 Tax=Paraglomus occultum TaxID=144539 RepID=A0A9N9DH57_9GLOM|nr:2120_t:CDS:2 [Paraglomus occultum]
MRKRTVHQSRQGDILVPPFPLALPLKELMASNTTNPFFLYRRHYLAKTKDAKSVGVKKAPQKWRRESIQVRQFFIALADACKSRRKKEESEEDDDGLAQSLRQIFGITSPLSAPFIADADTNHVTSLYNLPFYPLR